MIPAYTATIEQNGYAIIPQVLAPNDVATLWSELTTLNNARGIIRQKQSTYGIRNLLSLAPSVRTLTQTEAIRALIEPVLGDEAFVTRDIFFDKTPEANWSVAWHQDLAIAVQKKVEVAGFGP